MGMPITIEIIDPPAAQTAAQVFGWFEEVDQRFSPYIQTSEVCRLGSGTIDVSSVSADFREVLELAEATRLQSDGAFNIMSPTGVIDPSGIVKGWAISRAARMLETAGARNFFVEAGGDIQTHGTTEAGEPWSVGIRSPFTFEDIIKVVQLSGQGIATSGAYIRGDHIYDGRNPARKLEEIVSVSVIADDIVDADRFATAAYAMGREGIYFLEETDGVEAYVVDAQGLATQTSGFGRFAR